LLKEVAGEEEATLIITTKTAMIKHIGRTKIALKATRKGIHPIIAHIEVTKRTTTTTTNQPQHERASQASPARAPASQKLRRSSRNPSLHFLARFKS
jgi:hypothetical protein